MTDSSGGVRVLVTGANGQLGRAVVERAGFLGADVVALGHGQVAVEDADEVRRVIASSRPDVVVHCAAWTDVDGCERDPERADLVNGYGTSHVAEACRSLAADTKLVYVSTDFVFDGAATQPYRPCDDPAPISAYGRSKLLGERAVLRDSEQGFYVVRTSWVFGPGGKNFPAAILARARSGQALRVVDDQVGLPTYTPDLAEAVLELAGSGARGGIYHACNAAPALTWWRFATDIITAAGLDVEVAKMSSGELDRPAPRPAYSVLDCAGLTAVRGHELPDYRDAIRRYLRAETETDS